MVRIFVLPNVLKVNKSLLSVNRKVAKPYRSKLIIESFKAFVNKVTYPKISIDNDSIVLCLHSVRLLFVLLRQLFHRAMELL